MNLPYLAEVMLSDFHQLSEFASESTFVFVCVCVCVCLCGESECIHTIP